MKYKLYFYILAFSSYKKQQPKTQQREIKWAKKKVEKEKKVRAERKIHCHKPNCLMTFKRKFGFNWVKLSKMG